jgi:hypothetical protein
LPLRVRKTKKLLIFINATILNSYERNPLLQINMWKDAGIIFLMLKD